MVGFQCVVGWLWLSAGAVAGAQVPSLGVDDAVKIGLKKNPQVAAGRAGVASALATYRSAAALPPITLSGTHVQGTSTAPTLNGTNNDTFIDLGETFDLSGQKRYQAAGANATYKATKYTFDETLLTLEQQIRDAYWSLAAAQAQTKIADVSLKEAQKVYDLTVQQQTAGAAPRGDVVRSSIDVANAKQALLTAQGAERTALFTFNNLLARDPSTPTILADDLTTEDTPPDFQVPDLKELSTEATKSRALVLSAEESRNAANYALRQAESSRFPDLGIDYQRSTQQSVDTILFTASIPLVDFGSVSQSIKAARESRKQAEAQLAQTRQQVQQQVAQAHADLELALKSAADYKKEILDPSTTLLDMAQLGYKQGATGILPVMDAESTIRSARVGYINSLLAAYKAQDEILAATGKLPTQKGK
ncbi:MAG TPA: TolC family protein [Fimbriimonas sp.]|nr:TolC family protein [Fimbriimonas sp.]